jgi:hypothetical protein
MASADEMSLAAAYRNGSLAAALGTNISLFKVAWWQLFLFFSDSVKPRQRQR